MTVTTMTIGDLCVSPFNVRKRVHNDVEVAELADSLLACGQIHPLTVHAMDGDQRFGVLAGNGRRLAFTLLVEDGRLRANHPINVNLMEGLSAGELIELSMAENIHHELKPFEIFEAVTRARAEGRTIAQIAHAMGQETDTIVRWARLGELHPTVFAALEAGELSEQQAQAFGSTDDQALQLWAYEQIAGQSMLHARSPAKIRQLLKVGDAEERRLLIFVGEWEYRQAGGRYELDLFADDTEERGRASNPGLLREMVETKLGAARDRLRQQLGRDLRFEERYPRDGEYGGVAQDLEITGIWAATVPGQDMLDFIELEIAELRAKAAALIEQPRSPEREAAIDALEAEFAPLEFARLHHEATRTLTLPEGDIFATLIVEPDGQLETRFWWASRKAMRAAQKKGDFPSTAVSAGPIAKPAAQVDTRPPVTGSAALERRTDWSAPQRADAAIREDHGLTADAIQALRSTRRMVLRAGLIKDACTGTGSVAQDYLLWSLARDRFGAMLSGYAHDRGIGGLASLDDTGHHAVAKDLAGGTEAAKIWKEAIAEFERHPSMTEKDLLAAFRAFAAEDWDWKALAAALVAGSVLFRTANADGYRVPLHDEIACLCGVSDDVAVHQLAEPSEQLVEMLPRAQRLALAEPYVDAATFRSWAKLKAGDLVAPVTRALRHAKTFVHPLLRFEPPGEAVEATTAEEVA